MRPKWSRAFRGQLPPGAQLDQGDSALLADRTWALNPQGYVIARSKGVKTLLHRLVIGAKPGEQVDHINHDTADNRRCNLRLATNSQNAANRAGKAPGCTSQYIGVYWYARVGKWLARVTSKRELVWFGYYDDEIQAAKARDVAAKRTWGKFARLNFG